MTALAWVNFLIFSFWFLLAADFVLILVLIGMELKRWWKERKDD